jgi:hypothetical protein
LGLEISFAESLRLFRPKGTFISVEIGLDSSFVGELALWCFALLISAIQLGCAGGACVVTFGFSFASEDSSQLDFVGLHLFDGLAGEPSSASSLLKLRMDATDFERLWLRDGSEGLTKPSSSLFVGLSSDFCVTVRLLWLEVGRELGSNELSRLERADDARSVTGTVPP